MLNPNAFQFPPVPLEDDTNTGVFPVDFLLETVIRAGLDWFVSDVKAPKIVFGHLSADWLASKYGDNKIAEIAAFIKKYQIRIVQHWSLIDATLPTISIQLLDGNEMIERTAMDDFQGQIDVLNADQEVQERVTVGYSPVIDNMQLGIHTSSTPDLTKYIYYLLIYILNAFKPQLEQRGLMLGTYRATDLSRMNDYLPTNIYSRFINFTVFTIATFNKEDVPILDQILGVHVPPSDIAIADINLGIIPVAPEENA